MQKPKLKYKKRVMADNEREREESERGYNQYSYKDGLTKGRGM